MRKRPLLIRFPAKTREKNNTARIVVYFLSIARCSGIIPIYGMYTKHIKYVTKVLLLFLSSSRRFSEVSLRAKKKTKEEEEETLRTTSRRWTDIEGCWKRKSWIDECVETSKDIITPLPNSVKSGYLTAMNFTSAMILWKLWTIHERTWEEWIYMC